jgi:hypothetical protein
MKQEKGLTEANYRLQTLVRTDPLNRSSKQRQLFEKMVRTGKILFP